MQTSDKTSASSIIVFFMLATIAAYQYYSDIVKKERPPIPPSLVPTQIIKIADLGLHSAFASLMWIYTIQYVAEQPKIIPSLIESVNAIDPKFSYPYAFAALTLTYNSKTPKKAIEIAERGVSNADPDWRIPFYLATTYHTFFKNRERAAYYFDLASRTPGTNDKIRTIASLYGTAPDRREQTKQIWVSIYESSNDETVVERAKNYIIHIELIEALEKAVLIYRQRYGFYPPNFDELVTKKIIKEVPQSPLGIKFQIFPNGRVTAK